MLQNVCRLLGLEDFQLLQDDDCSEEKKIKNAEVKDRCDYGKRNSIEWDYNDKNGDYSDPYHYPPMLWVMYKRFPVHKKRDYKGYEHDHCNTDDRDYEWESRGG